MAGERLGRFYEAVVVVALKQVSSVKASHVFWDEPVSVLSKRPDVIVGTSLESPRAILLVTHSGSAKESNRKYWRSVCEFVEAKSLLETLPGVINVVFDDVIKPDIAALFTYSFDASISVASLPAAVELLKWSKNLAPQLPKEKLAQEQFVMEALAALPTRSLVASAIGELRNALEHALAAAAKGRDLVTVRKRDGTSSAAPRTTGLRRGVAKALLLDDPTDIWGTRGKRSVPPHYMQLELFSQSIAGPILADPDLLWIKSGIDRELAERLIKSAPRQQMNVWLEPLRNLSTLERQHAYVFEHWGSLCTPKGLLDHLKATSAAPFLVKTFGGAYVPPGWLFEYLRELVKANAGRKTAWGWSVLISDLQRAETDPGYRKFVARSVGVPEGELDDDWSGYRTVTYALPEWIMGNSRQNFPLRATDLPRTAYVFAPHVANVDPSKLAQLKSQITEFYIANYLEAKLIQYRNFDPLRDLVEAALTRARLPYKVVERFPSAFVERALAAGARLNVRTGCTEVVQTSSTLVAWQSISEQGRDHKTKELIGRAYAVAHTWDGERFVPRSGVRRLCLLLDGEVDAADITALIRGGWDDVVYPDEMDKLVKAIV